MCPLLWGIGFGGYSELSLIEKMSDRIKNQFLRAIYNAWSYNYSSYSFDAART